MVKVLSKQRVDMAATTWSEREEGEAVGREVYRLPAQEGAELISLREFLWTVSSEAAERERTWESLRRL